MGEFSDKVYVITGAAGNLGQAVARTFHQAGARLVLVDRQPDRLAEVFADLKETNTVYFANAVDLTDEPGVKEMFAAAHKHFGRLDGLVNTAGGYRAGKAAHEDTLANWEFMMDLNARTVWIASRGIVPYLQLQGGGHIVNVGAYAARAGKARMAAYISAKSAVIRLTESMAEELRGDRINVNCILPASIDTPENRAGSPNADYSKWVTPEAISEVILFLCSQAARPVFGASIPVRGSG